MTAKLARFATFAKPRPSGFVPLRGRGKLGKSLPCSLWRFASQGPGAAAAFNGSQGLHSGFRPSPWLLAEQHAHDSHIGGPTYRPSPASRLVVRVTAEPNLVVAAHWDLPRAPRLKRAHQDRRRERRSDEHELLKQLPLDRPKSAKQRDQKRNREDWRSPYRRCG